MNRATIDFGIDLGTTNSAIALLKGTEVEVIKNNEGFEYTPSAVWIDKKERLYVGRRAKERLDEDSENAFCEFKLQMGTGTEYIFKRNNRRMRPEELSAEVLKALKSDVKQRKGEEMQASVVTVPAAFELPQCEATKRAANMAGFTLCPLLQEPVAAALAYSFQSESDNIFWLVYDFGGGTFDAAVIQVLDGVIQVVNHGGDNHLGGKLIDWAIVDQLLVPALLKEYSLTDFQRGNSRWRTAFAKLKLAAERAKILVSHDESSEIIIDFLGQDTKGEAMRFDFELKREDVERLSAPFILRSMNICKKVLAEKHLGVDTIEKVLLVGGPTLMPYLRECLSDAKKGLGIPVIFDIDPITVVGAGAAVFAGTQRIKGLAKKSVSSGQYVIELEYKPVEADAEPLVGGKVAASGDKDFSGFTIEFINAEAQPPWRSGKLGLAPNGTFMTTLWAEKGKANTYSIELCDPTGTILKTVPSNLTYTIGLSISDPPLIHSIGVAMANNEMDRFFEKGISLPARRRIIHKTTSAVRIGQEGDLIRIPVVEGENKLKADRNKLIGLLEISADKIKRDLPVGSEVEITLEIDQSRLMRTKAYIPLLDEEYEEVLKLEKKIPTTEALKKDSEDEKKRLEQIRAKARETNDLKAQQVLQKIEREEMVHDVEAALAAAGADRDSADKCQNRLLDLKSAIDEIEDALEWPAMLAEAERQLKCLHEVVSQHGNSIDRQNAASLDQETQQAIEAREADLLRSKINEINILTGRVLREQPGFWVGMLGQLEGMKSRMRDFSLAEQLIIQGRRSINSNDINGLKTAVANLITLLPTEQQEKVRRGYGGTTQI